MSVAISIIIPCFNRVELLKETIKSVARAIEGLHAEVILVDDGSDIPISEQITEFAHLPIINIRQKNAGLTTSRYNGLLAAKGEYIQFLDSDDQVAAAKFKMQIEQMRQTNADVSHTDILHCRIGKHNNELIIVSESWVQHTVEPALFYISVQPTPHSPIFRRAYITPVILKSFIALSREYDPIAEAWFYYNLSIYPANIIKVNQPLTLYIHHDEARITNYWEWQALSALSLMNEFTMCIPKKNKNYIHASKKQVAIAAFKTYRGLPGNIDKELQEAFISIWQRLGKCAVKDLGGGKYFYFLSEIIGPVTVAKLFKKLNHNDYRYTKTVPQLELNNRLRPILNKLAISRLEKKTMPTNGNDDTVCFNSDTVCFNSEKVIRNMPSNYLEDELDFCRDEFSYQTNQICKVSFKDCYVNFKGYLYNSRYSLIEKSLIAKELDSDSFFCYLRSVVLGKKRKLTKDNTYLLCFDQWSGNHYHWINDFLPRLCVLADQLKNYILLLPDVPYIKNVGLQMLPYFNLQPDQIEWIQSNEVLKIPKLHFVSHPVITGRSHDKLIQLLKNRLKPPTTKMQKARRLYVSRSKSKQRFILNEAAVVRLLQQYDFEVVYFESLTFQEQIALVSEANLLVSIHGAGLANAIFMNDNSAVLEFRRDKIYINQCFWHLSSALGLKYYYLFGLPDQDIAIEGQGCNLTIPIDKLQVTIERILRDLSN